MNKDFKKDLVKTIRKLSKEMPYSEIGGYLTLCDLVFCVLRKEIAKQIKDGYSTRDLAAYYGISYSNFARYLKKHGIQTNYANGKRKTGKRVKIT